MAFVALLLTGVAFYFGNNVMPTAMLKYRSTLYDITRKKPAVNIRAGEYYTDLDGYVIRVGEKRDDGRDLRDVVIYDHSRGSREVNVVVAKHGTMQLSADGNNLRFTLYDGYSYSELSNGENFSRRPFTTIGFGEQSINIDISSFAFNRSDDESFKGSYQMKNVAQLDTSIDGLQRALDKRIAEYRESILLGFRGWQQYLGADSLPRADKAFDLGKRISALPPRERDRVYLHARNMAVGAAQDAKMHAEIFEADREFINRHYIELHRKFTLSVACLLLFLIGAPFGSIVRKGGLGLPLVASVGFFVLYYVVGMIAEKAVRESALGPEGMWLSSLVMLPIGIVLTLQATTDSSFFDGSSWRKFFQRLFRRSSK
jgi:lipopolysaccharide export system permease protein